LTRVVDALATTREEVVQRQSRHLVAAAYHGTVSTLDKYPREDEVTAHNDAGPTLQITDTAIDERERQRGRGRERGSVSERESESEREREKESRANKPGEYVAGSCAEQNTPPRHSDATHTLPALQWTATTLRGSADSHASME
jgi:hypothetical protein